MRVATTRENAEKAKQVPHREVGGVYLNPVGPQEDVRTMPDQRLHACIVLLGKTRRWATEQLMGLIGEVQRRGLHLRQGAGSLREYIQRQTGLEATKIRLALRLSEALERLPKLRWVFEHGWTTPHKVRVVLTVATPENDATCAQNVVKLSKAELEEWARGCRRKLQLEETVTKEAQARDSDESRPFSAVAAPSRSPAVSAANPGSAGEGQRVAGGPHPAVQVGSGVRAEHAPLRDPLEAACGYPGKPEASGSGKESACSPVPVHEASPASDPSTMARPDSLEDQPIPSICETGTHRQPVDRSTPTGSRPVPLVCERCGRVGVRLVVNGRPGTWFPDEPESSDDVPGHVAEDDVPGRGDPGRTAVGAETRTVGPDESAPGATRCPIGPSAAAKEHTTDLATEQAALSAWLKTQGTSTRHVPARVERFVRRRAEDACEYPACRQPGEILHHGRPFGAHHSHDPEHLYWLCRTHASLADRGLVAPAGPGDRTLTVKLERPAIGSSEDILTARLQRRYEEERSRASGGELG